MTLRQAYEFMYYELLSNKLDVCLIPSIYPDIAADGGCYRAVSQNNPNWYSELCRQYPRDGQSIRRKKIRTIVKRQEILRTLCRLKDGYPCKSKHLCYLKDVADQLIVDSSMSDDDIRFFTTFGELPKPFTEQF
jgi:hypothetical protein